MIQTSPMNDNEHPNSQDNATSNPLTRLAISSEGFIFDPATGDSFMANESAQTILRCFQQGYTSEQTTEELKRTFDVSQSELLQDILDFQARLNSFGLQVSI